MIISHGALLEDVYGTSDISVKKKKDKKKKGQNNNSNNNGLQFLPEMESIS